MTDLEQQVQLSGRLPTVEEYMRRRMGSSAVRVCLAITESVFLTVIMLTNRAKVCHWNHNPTQCYGRRGYESRMD